MQIEVRWRPRIASGNNASDKSFSGETGDVKEEVLTHIDRLYLNQTTIKHPDRAETTKFWNFSLLEISRTLQSALEAAVSQDASHLWVDISHHRIDMLLTNSAESQVVQRSNAEDSLGTVQAHPLYRAPHEETEVGATR
jgi:hypothetical protein